MENLRYLKTMEDVRYEKLRVRERLNAREKELSRKMYEIPAELAAAGANNFIPSFLRGKVTNAALSGGKKIINALLVPSENNAGLLPKATKGFSLLSGLKKAVSLWRKR